MSVSSSSESLFQSVSCANCGADFAEAAIRKIVEPQVEAARQEFERDLVKAADAKVAELMAAAKAKLEEQAESQARADAEYRQKIDDQIAALAEKDDKLQRAQEVELNLRGEKRRLEADRDEWDLHVARLRDEITDAERERASQQLTDRIALERDRIENQFRATIADLEDRAKQQGDQLAASAEQRIQLKQELTAQAEAKAAATIAAFRQEFAGQEQAQRQKLADLHLQLENKDAEISAQKSELALQLEAKHAEEMLRVAEDGEDAVIGDGVDRGVNMAPPGMLGGAVVGVVTG